MLAVLFALIFDSSWPADAKEVMQIDQIWLNIFTPLLIFVRAWYTKLSNSYQWEFVIFGRMIFNLVRLFCEADRDNLPLTIAKNAGTFVHFVVFARDYHQPGVQLQNSRFIACPQDQLRQATIHLLRYGRLIELITANQVGKFLRQTLNLTIRCDCSPVCRFSMNLFITYYLLPMPFIGDWFLLDLKQQQVRGNLMN